MLQRDNEKHRSTASVLRPALRRIKTVLTFLLRELVRRSWLRLIVVAILGTLGRVLGLLAIVVALKGFIIALDLDRFSNVAERVLASFGFAISVSRTELVIFIVATLATVSLMAFAATFLRAVAIRALIRQFLAESVQNAQELTLSTDEFMITRVAPSIDNVAKLIEIIMFSGIVCLVIALVSPGIALFLLPLLAVIPLAVLVSSRHNLGNVDRSRRGYRTYRSTFPTKSDDPSDVEKWVKNERADYITARLKAQRQQLQSQQTGQLIVLGVIAILIVYLAVAGMERVDVLSIPLPLIFIILALRQLLTCAREFGITLSRLLELRDGLDKVYVDDKQPSLSGSNFR